MFPKVALTFLLIGALSVNALTAPVARSPAPEPESQELFSREPEDWAQWAGSAREYYAAKREPSPIKVKTKPRPEPEPTAPRPERKGSYPLPPNSLR